MGIDLKATFRNFSPPLHARKQIRDHLDRLARLYPDIVSCDVVTEEFHGHQPEGHRYRVALAVILSGGEILADHEHHNKHANESFSAAVEDAFAAMTRVLKGHAQGQAAVS